MGGWWVTEGAGQAGEGSTWARPRGEHGLVYMENSQESGPARAKAPFLGGAGGKTGR